MSDSVKKILKYAIKSIVTAAGAIIGIAVFKPISEEVAKAITGEEVKDESNF